MSNIAKIEFSVQGSSPEPYTVEFIKKSEGNLSAYCSCHAGQNGQYCKHRIRILQGDSEGIINTNLDDVRIVSSWLHGSDIEIALKRVLQLEADAEEIKKELSKAKKSLAKTLMD